MADPILILHLSDLHFGPNSRFAGVEVDAARRFVQAVQEASRALGVEAPLSLVISTGDIAEAAFKKEYEQAKLFYEALVGGLGLSRERFVFLPGNHDVSWNQCQRVMLDQQEEGFGEGELRKRLDEVKLRPFEAFLEDFYGHPRAKLPNTISLGYGAFVHDYPELKLSIAALNSCEKESHRDADHVGQISQQQAQSLMACWRDPARRRSLKLVGVHHNPVATIPSEVQGWAKWLEQQMEKGALKKEHFARFAADAVGLEGLENLRAVAADCQVQVILHGHHHAADRNGWPWRGAPGSAWVLSSGSWGADDKHLPALQKNMAHLLLLDPGERRLHSALRKYSPTARADGAVGLGHFALDPDEPDGQELQLSLPLGFDPTPGGGGGGGGGGGRKTMEFVAEFRNRFLDHFSRWDLRGIGAIARGSRDGGVDTSLDDMYLPLRLGEGIKPDETDRGAVLSPEDLLQRARCLAIRGAAGAGKTTWMRWTFRRLVEGHAALPLFVELRDLAAMWADPSCPREHRSLDRYLQCWIQRNMGEGWSGRLAEALGDASGPRPVLLVDGWDELGELGATLRDQLMGFLRVYPRVLAVVTSRPYGEGRPSTAEHFDVLDLQPLSDPEIEQVADRFTRRVYGEEGGVALARVEAFLKALRSTPEAHALAHTPLLLTMLLLISRDRPLPDRRHKLYQVTIENLLSSRIKMYEDGGVQLLREHWRPADSDERWRTVALLAYRVQTEGYKESMRAPIVRHEDALISWLPGDWPEPQRRGFLGWLAGPAGVLVDRSDGRYAFTHLSFQEFLTAWHLFTHADGQPKRLQVIQDHIRDQNWWETLRLWGALVQAHNQEHLAPVLESLAQDPERGFWLAGEMAADGLGEDPWFQAWRDALPQRLWIAQEPSWSRCARAWANSKQAERRELLQALPQNAVNQALGPQWLHLATWWSNASLEGHPPRPDRGLAAYLCSFVAERSLSTHKETVATSRYFSNVNPLNSYDKSFILLRCCAGHRSLIGQYLQSIHLTLPQRIEFIRFVNVLREFLGMESEDIDQNFYKQVFGRFLHGSRDSIMPGFSIAVSPNFFHPFSLSFFHDLPILLYGKFLNYTSGEFLMAFFHAFFLDFSSDFSSEFYIYLYQQFLGDFSNALRYAFSNSSDFSIGFYRDFSIKPEQGGSREFSLLLFSAFGRIGPTPWLASMPLQRADPLLLLAQHACRLFYAPQADASAFEEAAANLGGDPLWPACARHVARRSTPEDRELITSLIRNPELREPPLRWVLQYYMRGDVLLEDGRDVTLDQLCDEAGSPPLPYLEDPYPLPDWFLAEAGEPS